MNVNENLIFGEFGNISVTAGSSNFS